MGTTWTALVVTVAPELADSVGSFLVDRGAPGLITEDVGQAVRLTAHFAGDAPLADLTRYAGVLRDLFPAVPPLRFETYPVRETDWAENWKEHFPPLAIGRRLFVHPPWVDSVPPGRLGIVIDPGMAFGTGHHATTRGCLLFLERADPSKSGTRVCDLGTGSGILAIAAAKLGAADVWAMDIDPDACRVAEENAAINGVGVQVRGALEDVPGVFDIILANLLGQLLIDLAPTIAHRLSPGATVISAGLRSDEEESVARAWRVAHLTFVDRFEEDGWVTLMHRRQ